MTNAFLLVFACSLIAGCVGSYYLGRYQAVLLDKIRTLEGQAREPVVEALKPSVAGGAYQPPTGTIGNNKLGAGIVETKTPQQLDWENQVEIENLSKL